MLTWTFQKPSEGQSSRAEAFGQHSILKYQLNEGVTLTTNIVTAIRLLVTVTSPLQCFQRRIEYISRHTHLETII